MDKELKKKILLDVMWATIEEYARPYEIVWEINSVYEEGTKNGDNKNIALKILTRFFADGFIEVLEGTYTKSLKIDNTIKALELLNNNNSWEIDNGDGNLIRISATEKGKSFYNKLYDTDDIDSLYKEDIG